MASQGEILVEAGAPNATARASLLNFSRGGLCARGALPEPLGSARQTDSLERRDDVLRIALGLLDGTPLIWASAKLAWRAIDPSDPEHTLTFGLRFVDLSDGDRQLLDAAIETRDRAAAATGMRLRLSGGAVLRTTVESQEDGGALLGAELPWLRVGADMEAELDGRWIAARASWIGLDTSPSGAARLRMRVVFQPDPAPRRDATLTHFSTPAAAGATTGTGSVAATAGAGACLRKRAVAYAATSATTTTAVRAIARATRRRAPSRTSSIARRPPVRTSAAVAGAAVRVSSQEIARRSAVSPAAAGVLK